MLGLVGSNLEEGQAGQGRSDRSEKSTDCLQGGSGVSPPYALCPVPVRL